MYKQETVNPYNNIEGKGKQVEAMFNNIAPAYDSLNHRLSWDIDKKWREKAIRLLLPYKPQEILDVATGTGDFAILAAKRLCPQVVTGIDISEGMMKIAREKVRMQQLEKVINFKREDCMGTSFADNTFDAVISAFGVRNFQSLDKGLSEIFRVLKKGGHLCVAELTKPISFPMKELFYIYSHTILPIYGKLISKDAKAYDYLTASIEAFPQGEQMMDILKKAGFRNTQFKRLTFGICTIYLAEK